MYGADQAAFTPEAEHDPRHESFSAAVIDTAAAFQKLILFIEELPW